MSHADAGRIAALKTLLGLPDTSAAATGAVGNATPGDGFNRFDFTMSGCPAIYLRPDRSGPLPAVLYCHAHGGAYGLGRHELLEGAWWLTAPLGPSLARAGFAVLAVDMPGFGGRVGEGSESALAKEGLWRGQPLFGQMIADQQSALGWLASQPEVDAGRIAAVGTSMGGLLAFWTAALDRRITAVAHLCVLADIAGLIEAGAHDLHGHFLTVPGLLNVSDMGAVAALIAPRPQFVAHGGADALTPAPARDTALATLRAAYSTADELETLLVPEAGHTETPEMRHALLDFLKRRLAPA